MLKKILILVSLVLVFPNISFSEGYDDSDALDLETIVVTPTRSETTYAKAARSFDVLKSDSIERAKVDNTLANIIDSLPAAKIVDYGGVGQQKKVELRGVDSSNVLIMIDSRIINSPRDGSADLSKIPLDNIERIEVVRGPSSSLYGSSASGGVINIITKRAKKDYFSYETNIGSFKTWRNLLNYGAKIRDLDYNLSFSNITSKGYRDNSEYQEYDFNSKVGYELGSMNSFVFTAGTFSDKANLPGRVEMPTLDDRQLDSKNYMDFEWDFKPSDDTTIKTKLYQNYDRLEVYESYVPLVKSTHTTKMRSMDFSLDQKMTYFYDIVAGFNGQENGINSSDSGKHRYLVRSFYIDNHFDLDRLQIYFGGRTDNYSFLANDKTKFNPSCNASYEIAKYLKIRGLIGTSFRVPTFNDLFWPATPWAEGNPQLSPEKGFSYEVGMDLVNTNGINIALTYFKSKFKDKISWAEGSDFVWRPTNISNSTIDGIEIGPKIRLMENLDGSVSYTFLRTIDDATKKDIPYKPRNKLSAILTYNLPDNFKATVSYYFSGKSFSDSEHLNTIKAYSVVNLYVNKSITRHFEAFLGIDNLFNLKYQKISGYPMPPFTLNVGGKVKF